MRISATCMECFKELGRPSFEMFSLPYYENRIAVVQCSHGHKSALVLQSQKFEVLMESGAEALLNGFTLEACATFYAALERTYEFAICVLMKARGVDDQQYSSMFNEMSRMSERQVGAFMALHLLETGMPYKIDNALTKFRNSVIHKGAIPEPDKAHDFCSKVFAKIIGITEILTLKYPELVHKIIRLDMQKRISEMGEKLPIASATGTIFFSLSKAQNNRDFDEAMQSFKVAMQMLPAR
ncbi:hypothetical protein HAY23_004600 [Salmonella enterica]|uniref:Uncharacterized protein n=2 Tax=Salmonella enterica TaxID=28901 RepID=A0A731NFQ4_SALER|nr:hypothetical protein [Salmonella enterica]ECJ2984647.1 hypothetical protein [Salmonella enterica subsp. salamae]AZT24124.1 hypothetical protein ELZ76_09380 [Salmonella enterica subsp. salamae serovar 42:r:-]AZT50423.1 hypothetical protein EL003_09345 [Salmonella enterica subsp. salamae serovar 42:r:-]EAA9059835.1 hypothetical protein [Salmonella enterica]EAU0241326.1 hypothetical protein [Salmonella enterica]